MIPLSVKIKIRMLNYWCRLINSDNSKIAHILYNTLLGAFYRNNQVLSNWLTCIYNILNKMGFSNYWLSQQACPKIFKNIVNVRQTDIFIQEWNETMFNNSKCITYRAFKDKFQFENYLVKLPTKLRILFCRFRVSNHKLPVETGRYINLPHDQRICHLCNSNNLGDEFHYLFECTYFSNDRKKFLKNYFIKNPNMLKMYTLFNSEKYLKSIVGFIKVIFDKF